ncbi:hypothetical protein E9228_002315 [Curtobacterium flaccumfaciens]|uniref:Putative zinc-finger domain-containing protein n=1 Tax=Curtobacterium salicis TaxID=1779862 RepID=A0ABX0TBV6_9MICO|nr:zf-HC2 domain-containing protein [Curtobacterium sp. WW7]NII41668.1 hypothetical protein [Curtobacterium sp. WW7]
MSEDRYAEWDAAYVLGSLPPAERLEYERHLEHCDGCRSAVAELAGLPGLLGRLPADAAVEIAEPDGRPLTGHESTLASVAHRVRRRRRRRRAVVAVSAGFAVVVAVVAGLGVGLRADAPGTEAVAPTVSAGASADRYALTGKSGFDVDLAVRAESWGTRFDWGCSYGGRDWSADGSVMYDLVVVRTDGSDERIASWTAAGREARGLSATTDVPRADIASVEVRLRGETGTLARTDL